MIFGIEIRSNVGKILAWLFVLIVIMGLLMAFFPLMQENNILSLVDSFREGFSGRLRHILGLSKELDFSDLRDYIPFIYQYMAVLFGILAIQLGAKSLVKEQSAGTIEYLYSQPISRSQILTEKFFANLFLYLLLVLLTLASTLGFSYIFSGGDFAIRDLVLVMGQIFLSLVVLGFLFLSIGYFYSAISNRASHTDGGSLLLFLLLVILWILLVFFVKKSSFIGLVPFEALNPLTMAKDGLQTLGLAVNFVAGLIFIGLSQLIYRSKELKF